MTTFQYSSQILEDFPNLVSGVVVIRNVKNDINPDGLEDAYNAEQVAVMARIGTKALSEIASLTAWRKVFRQFGVEPTKYRSAPEALLRRLRKKGYIPHINSLVDIGNLISIRYALPVAIFDTDATNGVITVRYADGSERYCGLHEKEVHHPDVGEVIFADDTGLVVARRWCWRQSAESAAQSRTNNVVITIEAQHDNSRTDIQNALNDMIVLLETYIEGEAEHAILDYDNYRI